jgi:hypothetical protein
MEEDIVECIPTIPFWSTSNVGMVIFVDPHKVVAQRSAFSVLGNVLNDGVLKVRIESFGHARLKYSFSQVEEDLDLQEIPKLALFPKKRATKKNMAIVTTKEEDEEGEKAGKFWVDGEVLHLIALQGEMELEFTKNAKKQGKFQLIETLEFFLRFDFCSIFIIETCI